MTRTAIQEHYGTSVDTAIAANYQMSLPSYEGGVRLYVLRPSAGGLSAILPVATFCRLGGPLFHVVNAGSFTMTVKDLLGTTIATINVGQNVAIWLKDKSLPWGTWSARVRSSTVGASLAVNRIPIDIRLTQTIRNGFNLRDRVVALGYTIGSTIPFAVRCTIAAGIVIGNEAATPGFNTGDSWPAGSTLLLGFEAGARICGRGGAGGRGGDVPPGLLSAAGAAGGVAFRTYLTTAITGAAGLIQGGGGGGGGGTYYSGVPGGGGGGGAGFIESVGGLAGHLQGSSVPYPGGSGQPGSVGLAGLGGITVVLQPTTYGGNGGGPGLAGSAGGGNPGGAAGNAIERLSSVTVTFIEAVTVNGPQVFF